MENEYRPFFSRKQLNILMWFSLIAILVLTSLGPGEVEYQEIQHNQNKTVYWMELDEQLNTLTLLLPSEPALNSSHQQLQQLKAQVLLSRLKKLNSTTYTYNVYPRQDRIELSLSWAVDNKTPDIQQLLKELQQPVQSNNWMEVLKTLKARDYLNGKAIEEQAIEKFFTYFQAEIPDTLITLPSSYTRLFDNITYVISGHNAEEIMEHISAINPDHSGAQFNSMQTPLAADLELKSDQSPLFVFLTGEPIPPRADEQFAAQRVSAQVLQDLLESQQQSYNFKYRLLWGALHTTGYRAVIIKTDQPAKAILSQLQALITEDVVESSQSRLIAQWQERMRDLKNQIQAMSLIAYYDLPLTTMEDYAEQIEDVDDEQVVMLARKALDTDLHINIMLSPSN